MDGKTGKYINKERFSRLGIKTFIAVLLELCAEEGREVL
jgi:hypothetical protein